jgi:hypothetical protein
VGRTKETAKQGRMFQKHANDIKQTQLEKHN